ncbi:MAG: bifunctional (p)ppGpp synthetase/guanosine-3',5'-bis(diphosphate) 3'-pyrophosphohydrolase [Bacteroidales bacterium]|nr:bifunctional (p)ppGpp synthetase/guanosine-3',5'-bis(diphosphate) 3'-pyrophosphohydrolase [Bacteroidales bacterium]
MNTSQQSIIQVIEYISKKTESKLNITPECIEVAEIVIKEMGLGEESIIATILHKPLKEGLLSFNVIENTFGKRIADLCNGVAQISNIRKQKAGLQTEHFIQLILTLSNDPRATLISLASQLNKLRKFEKLKPERKNDFLNEIKQLFAPVAHRLGLYSIKTEMEEIWMREAHPEIYRSIANNLSEKKAEREKFISEFIAPLKGKMKKAGLHAEIIGRPKTIFSIWNKMKKQGVDIEGIYDKFAIRIIIDDIPVNEEKDACWKAYSLVTENYRPFPKRLRDWISAPKASGYESLHTTVQTDDGKWVEVQIRTRRMDIIAEKGHAAHWKYKEGGKGNMEDWLREMREALENPDEERKTDVLKKSLYSKDIFIFTPADELKKLRYGSSVLDFAFSIHSHVGLSCKGAIVNGKFVSIRHKLNNGDRVEIQSSKRQKPSYEWMKYLSSPTNRAKLKRALKEQENRYSELGKDLLKSKLKQLEIGFSSDTISALIKYFKLEEPVELYELIGSRKIDITRLKKAIDSISAPEKVNLELKPEEEKTLSSIKTVDKEILIIDELKSRIDFVMAKCCNPVTGDAVFGFVTVNKGVKIHRKNCPNAYEMHLRYPYRIIEARWSGKENTTNHTARIKIIGLKEKNLIGLVINNIEEQKEVRMVKFVLQKKLEKFDAEVIIEAEDKTIINKLTEGIAKINGIDTAFLAE